MKTFPGIVDLKSPVYKCANKAEFVRTECKTKEISKKPRVGLFAKHRCDRKFKLAVVNENF